MQPEIRNIVAVQESELRIRALETEITALPKRLTEAETKHSAAAVEVKRVETALKAEETARRRMEDDIRDQRQRIARLRTQLDNVKTTEQLTALQHEMEFATAEIGRIEDRELASMEQTELLEAAQGKAAGSLTVAEKSRDAEKQYVRTASARLHGELATARKSREELRQSADATLLANYDRIAKAKKTGLAEVIGAECQACHMQMRPQQWNTLRAGERMNCESCGRMLYYDEGNDAKLAAGKAGQWDLPA